MRRKRTVVLFFSALCWLQALHAHPRVPSHLLDNNCQCDCCYTVGTRARTECVPPTATSFSVFSCSICDIHTCAAHFPTACAQLSSLVTATCIKREGWLLRIVPVFFITSVACLVVYGLCVRSFDGYHDETLLRRPHPRLMQPVSYHTFDATHGAHPSSQHAARPHLSTIVEERDQADATPPMTAALSNPLQQLHVQPSESEVKPVLHPQVPPEPYHVANQFVQHQSHTAPDQQAVHYTHHASDADGNHNIGHQHNPLLEAQPHGAAEPTLNTERQHQICAPYTTLPGNDMKQSDNSVTSAPDTPPSPTVNHPAAAHLEIGKHIVRTAAESVQAATERIVEDVEISEPTQTVTEAPKSTQVQVGAEPVTAPSAADGDRAPIHEAKSPFVSDNSEHSPSVTEVTRTTGDHDVAQHIRAVESDPVDALPTSGNDVLPKLDADEANAVASVRGNEDPIAVTDPEPALLSQLSESGQKVENLEAVVESSTCRVVDNCNDAHSGSQPSEHISTLVEIISEPLPKAEPASRTKTPTEIGDAMANPSDMSTAREDETNDIEQAKGKEEIRAHIGNEKRSQDAPVVDDGRPIEQIDPTSSDTHAQTEDIVGTETVSQEEPMIVMNAPTRTVEGGNLEVKDNLVSPRTEEATSEFQISVDLAPGEDGQLGTNAISDAFNSQSHVQGLGESDKSIHQSEASLPPVGTAVEVDSSGAVTCLAEIGHIADSNFGARLISKTETRKASRPEPTDGSNAREDDVQQGSDKLVLDTDGAKIVEELVESRFDGIEVEIKPQQEEQDTMSRTTESSTPNRLRARENSEDENIARTARREQGNRVEVDGEERNSSRAFSVVQLDSGVSETPAEESLLLLDPEERRQEHSDAVTGEVPDPRPIGSHAHTVHVDASGFDAVTFTEMKAEDSAAASTGRTVMNILRYECPAHNAEGQDAGEQAGNINDKHEANIESDTLATFDPQSNDRESHGTVTNCESSTHAESYVRTEHDIKSEITKEVEVESALGTKPVLDVQGSAVMVETEHEEMKGNEPLNETDTEEARRANLGEPNTQAESANTHHLPQTSEGPHEVVSAVGGTAEIEGIILTEEEKDEDTSTAGLYQRAEMVEGPPVENSEFLVNAEPVPQPIWEVEEGPKEVVESDAEVAVPGTEIHNNDMYEGVEPGEKTDKDEGCTAASNTEGSNTEGFVAAKGHAGDTGSICANKPSVESFHTSADTALPGTVMISTASEIPHDAEDNTKTFAADPEDDAFVGDSYDAVCPQERKVIPEESILANALNVEGDKIEESTPTGQVLMGKDIGEFGQHAEIKAFTACDAIEPTDNASGDVGASPSPSIATKSVLRCEPEEMEVISEVLDQQQ